MSRRARTKHAIVCRTSRLSLLKGQEIEVEKFKLKEKSVYFARPIGGIWNDGVQRNSKILLTKEDFRLI